MKSNKENLEYSSWINRLNAGDVAALEWLYNSFKYQLAKKLLRLLKSPDIVEDILHDIFVKLWDNRTKIDANRSLEGYMHRIAANSVADFYRQISNDQNYRQYLVTLKQTDYSHIEEALENKHQRELIDKALADLPPKCRTVFELCKMEGRSYEEVADLLHISPNTISNHLARANKKIQLFLQNPANLTYFILLSMAG
ncbi:sigma-70 family RNA polymerase sigma factor [Sphingobacterium phlebotomi]|uniref:Sigma-70 family RNA polymerase sigma factor n=1 Tax=Sphingobacterium phlebotomi TaxID=2605433 RepID=A0A5D4H8A2_9SPHI|nr:sigma-70 family RNA polymerase sigma factor [Sphingobacterium phlebotomi]TYR36908.1 sigma-70 family RNA polymerase sigma factor [Sphingobacterium phlebotomi]